MRTARERTARIVERRESDGAPPVAPGCGRPAGRERPLQTDAAMNWDALVKRLVELAPHRAPTEEELRVALLAAAEDADERELVTVEDPRTGFLETVAAAPCASLVRIWWQPSGPCASFVGIDLTRATDGSLLVQRDDSDDEMDWRILACLPPPPVSGALVRHLPALGARLEAARAPEEITNHAP